MNGKYGFPLCIQLVPPDDIYGDKEFADTLELLKEKGFYGVELNITDFQGIDPEKLKVFLASYNLKMTMIASGVFAKKNGLSLSSADETIRKKTVDAFDQMVRFAKKMNAGIICGFIKGGAGEDVQTVLTQMQKSVRELKEKYGNEKVNIYLEATNHYEATLINRVDEGIALAGDPSGIIKVLPDTYHMNIEESSMTAAMVGGKDYYHNIHISDNNRFFPGFGAIDFYQVMSLLKQMNYTGTISIEGRNQNALNGDIAKSCSYLEEIGKRL